MKKLLLPISVAGAFLVASCNMAGEADYDAMAKDMCDCVTKSSDGISDNMKDAIIKAEKDGTDMQAAMTEVMVKDLKTGMADAQAMIDLGTEMQTCSKDLEKKYENVYTTESKEQVIEKLLASLKSLKGCEFSYALMSMSAKEMKK